MKLSALFGLLAFSGSTLAKTVNFDWNLTWTMANPDGLAERKVMGINGAWPLPVVHINKGDRIVARMYNGLADKDASLHFHGFFMNGTNYQDGAPSLTQCPVPPGESFVYNFTVEQAGTYWYHCHTTKCYPDGYRQALIVHDNDEQYTGPVDDEFVLTISDWYHNLVEDIPFGLPNMTIDDVTPDSFLFNETRGLKLPVQPSHTYLLRLINIGAFVAQYFYIEGHSFDIVELDGVYVEPVKAKAIYIAPGQRYSILLRTKDDARVNYPMVTVVDSPLLNPIPAKLPLNMTNWLEYDSHKPFPQARIPFNTSDEIVPQDDISLVPQDRMPLLPEPDHEITMTLSMTYLENNVKYSFLDNITYTVPKVPLLYTAYSATAAAAAAANGTTSPNNSSLVANPAIYGSNTHTVLLNRGDVVQLVVNSRDDGSHPFHLHGHHFQTIYRNPPLAALNSLSDAKPVPFNPHNHTAFPAYPPRRDTFVLPGYGSMVLRWVADNPGVWFFHCHNDWHLAEGMAAVFVDGPEDIVAHNGPIPRDHLEMCRKVGMATKGNAAGNTRNWFNLTGEPVQPAWKG